MKCSPFIRPISIAVGFPVHANTSAPLRSCESMPAPLAKSFAVPSGRIPSEAFRVSSCLIIALTTAFSVPSPPPATIRSAPLLIDRRINPRRAFPFQGIKTSISTPDCRACFTAAFTSGRVQDFLCSTRPILECFFAIFSCSAPPQSDKHTMEIAVWRRSEWRQTAPNGRTARPLLAVKPTTLPAVQPAFFGWAASPKSPGL